MIERQVMAPPQRRAVNVAPSSWNAEARTVDVVWTTGARGARFDWQSMVVVNEELATAPANVRLTRLNAGAPVLDTHQRTALASQIGTVVPGSARMQGGQGIATLRLSDRPDLAPIVADIASGIIRNLSVGYTVHSYEIERVVGAPDLYRAIDWEPFEISFVPVPFDAQAQVRSHETAAQPCILRPFRFMETRSMTVPNEPALAPANAGNAAHGAPPATIAQLRQLGDIAQSSFNLPREAVNEIILEMAERSVTGPDAGLEMSRILGERQRRATSGISNHVTIDQGFINRSADRLSGSDATLDNPAFHARSIEDAIYARIAGSAPQGAARSFMHMSMVQMAGSLAQRAGVRDVAQMAPGEVLNAAAWNRNRSVPVDYLSRSASSAGYHTTSDFPELLTGAGQRFLLDMFAAASSPLKLLGRMRSARDFRALSGLQLSGFGTLPEVPESAEINYGTFKDRKESYQVKTFAKMFALSRQAIINDDLSAFGDPTRIMARAAAETEASLLAALINRNPVMSDANALFHSSHGNLASSGSVPTIATISAARLAMRSQKDLDGVTPLATGPKYILASPTFETTIEQMLAVVAHTEVENANPFAGKLIPLVDPRLDTLPWYMFSDPVASPVLEYAYLEGLEGPRIEMENGWDTLGTSFRVYMDFGAGLVDWRGAYKNPGAAPS